MSIPCNVIQNNSDTKSICYIFANYNNKTVINRRCVLPTQTTWFFSGLDQKPHQSSHPRSSISHNLIECCNNPGGLFYSHVPPHLLKPRSFCYSLPQNVPFYVPWKYHQSIPINLQIWCYHKEKQIYSVLSNHNSESSIYFSRPGVHCRFTVFFSGFFHNLS